MGLSNGNNSWLYVATMVLCDAIMVNLCNNFLSTWVPLNMWQNQDTWQLAPEQFIPCHQLNFWPKLHLQLLELEGSQGAPRHLYR